MQLGETKNLTVMTAAGFDHVYDMIEQVRCYTAKTFEDMELTFMAQTYRNYLVTQMNAIVEMVKTGRISPSLFGADRLEELINRDHVLQNSLLLHEPHLFYSFARGLPVRLDYQGFRFAFIVKIPVPTCREAHLSYQVFNVGFHSEKADTRDKREEKTESRVLVHRAALPERVFLRSATVLAPFDPKGCQMAEAITMCPKWAILPIINYPCLPVLANDGDFGAHCEENRECSADVTVSLEVATPELANTRAGVLVRVPHGEVAAYYREVVAAEKPVPVRISSL